MTTYCLRDGDTWVRVGANTVVGERRLSQRWLAGLTDEERAELGAAALVETAQPAGLKVLGETVEDVEGVPTQAWVTEPYTEEEVGDLRVAAVQAVKAEAGRRIVAVMTPEQQSNALALWQELITTHGPDPADWPSQDRATYEADAAHWASIRAIRTASNSIEAALPEDAAGLISFDASNAAGWPVEA